MNDDVKRHQKSDLIQMQSLPLDAKIIMTKQRIKVWYENWCKFEIVNTKTGKTRFVTFDTRDNREPELKENEYIESHKKKEKTSEEKQKENDEQEIG